MANSLHRCVYLGARSIRAPACRHCALLSNCIICAHDAVHRTGHSACTGIQPTGGLFDSFQPPHLAHVVWHETPWQLCALIHSNCLRNTLSLARSSEAELTRQFFPLLSRPQVHGFLERFHFQCVTIRRALIHSVLFNSILHMQVGVVHNSLSFLLKLTCNLSI